jgi:hypothetical protein
MPDTQTPGQTQGISQPLGDLDTNKYAYANFIYPLDLGASVAGKDHYIVFHINESYNTQYTTSGPGVGPNGSFVGPSQNRPMSQLGPEWNQSAININTMTNEWNADGTPKDPNGDPNGNSTNGKNGNSANQSVIAQMHRPTNRVATTIVLYMPPEITASYAANWSETELGMAKETVDLIKGGSLKDLFTSGGMSAIKHVGDWANSFTDMNLKDAASLASRLVINNHQEVIFNGITFRTFTFNFRFTPESEDEAVNVDNIIRAFKFYAAPEIMQGWAGRFWIYPAEFDIQYYSNGKPNDFLNKISTCACTNVSVNYTPVGHFAAFRPSQRLQGAPSVCTDISLSFMELELMTKIRVQQGYAFVPFWWLLPFLHPIIFKLHELFGFLTNYKPMPSYIESWSILAILSLIMLMGKSMWDLLPIHNNAGGNTAVMPLISGVMRSMKQFGNMVLKIFHLK